MLERRAAAQELVVDRARAVRALAPAEAGVDDDVLERLGALGPVDDVAQAALVVGAPLVLVEVGSDDDDGGSVAVGAQRERLVADLGLDRQLRVQLLGEHHRDSLCVGTVPTGRARISQIALLSGSGPASDGIARRGDAGAEPPGRVARLDREGVLDEEVARDEDQLERTGRRVQVALELEIPVRRTSARRSARRAGGGPR